MAARVLFHVQHLLGIGHWQRSLAIADALVRRGAEVIVIRGGPPVGGVPEPRGLTIVPLPPIRARDASFALIDAAGAPPDDALRDTRRGRVLAAFAAARPDIVVVEGFPFARRAFRFELDPLIAAARAAGTRVVSSVRDIPTVRAPRVAEVADRVRRDFDAVLVHGDRSFIPFEAAFPAAPEIADRLHYTGYVATPSPAAAAADPPPAGEVLVSVGGGAAGAALREAALAARRQGCLADRPWRILAGLAIDDGALAALRAAAPPGVAIERFRPDFAALLRRCHVSVSQAGYNTVLDILAARSRAVLVPFAAQRETEQSIRAAHLAARGAAVVLAESELSPASLAAALDRAAAGEPRPVALDTDGATASAAIIVALAGK